MHETRDRGIPLVCPSEQGTVLRNMGRVWTKVRERAAEAYRIRRGNTDPSQRELDRSGRRLWSCVVVGHERVRCQAVVFQHGGRVVRHRGRDDRPAYAEGSDRLQQIRDAREDHRRVTPGDCAFPVASISKRSEHRGIDERVVEIDDEPREERRWVRGYHSRSR